jgi:hypothetical protein
MSTPFAVQALRKQLFDSGFPFVPVVTGGKKPVGDEWPLRARTLNVDTANAYPDGKSLNTGILADGLVPIDIDTDDTALSAWIVQLAVTSFGTAPMRYRSNSAKCLLLYRSTDDRVSSANVCNATGQKILEVLGQGRQFVAYGVHPSQAPYCWTTELRAIERSSLTAVSPQQVGEFLTAVAEHVGGNASRSRLQIVATPAPFDPPSTVVPTEDEMGMAQAILNRLSDELRAMREGEGRNAALNIAAVQMGELSAGWGIPRQPIADALLQAMSENGYIAKDGLQEAKETLASGFSKGLSQPRARLPITPDIDVSRFLAKYDPCKQSPTPTLPALPRAVVLTGLANVQETPVQWHWPGYLPAGMLTLLSGAGGTGKSTLAFSFAATLSTGRLWPDGKACLTMGNVLIWSSEDSVAHTIKPRLIAAGANINRIAVIEGSTDANGRSVPFDPATDIDILRTEVRRIGGISLLIIDPIVSAVSGDMHKANDVRRSLQPIVDFAADFNCAVLGITHFAKNTGGRNAAERVIGSQAFSALARMVLVTAKEEDSDMRVFTRAKSNISEDEGGLHYTIEPLNIPTRNGEMQTTRVVWGDSIRGNARAILSSIEGDAEGRKPLNRVEEAAQFLRAELANGPVPARELIERAKRDLGVNERSLQRARERLGIEATKTGFQGAWVWSYLISPHFPG